MTSRMIGLAVVSLAAFFVASADDKASKESKVLQGEWRTVEIERDGKTLATDEVKNLRFVFEDDTMTIKSGDGSGGMRKKTFTLDTEKTPRQIDITSLDGRETGQTASCIYTLEKDRLKLCMPYAPKNDKTERPIEFKTKAGDGLMIFILERVKSKE